jgi:hypothetical protein
LRPFLLGVESCIEDWRTAKDSHGNGDVFIKATHEMSEIVEGILACSLLDFKRQLTL